MQITKIVLTQLPDDFSAKIHHKRHGAVKLKVDLFMDVFKEDHLPLWMTPPRSLLDILNDLGIEIRSVS